MGGGEGGRIKEFHNISDWENVSPNQQTEYSLGEICLISDQGCGSAVRVVLREFLAQSEMREDHNYYGSLFFWECQPSFADPGGLNNLKSGLAVELFLSLLSVTWGCSLLFSKPVSCLTSEALLSSEWRSLFSRATCPNAPAGRAWPRKAGWVCWAGFAELGLTGAGLCGLGVSDHVRSLDEHHQTTGLMVPFPLWKVTL